MTVNRTSAPVDRFDERIAAERRYIAAASVAELAPDSTELALPAAPRTRTISNRGTHAATYTTTWDAIHPEDRRWRGWTQHERMQKLRPAPSRCTRPGDT